MPANAVRLDCLGEERSEGSRRYGVRSSGRHMQSGRPLVACWFSRGTKGVGAGWSWRGSGDVLQCARCLPLTLVVTCGATGDIPQLCYAIINSTACHRISYFRGPSACVPLHCLLVACLCRLHTAYCAVNHCWVSTVLPLTLDHPHRLCRTDLQLPRILSQKSAPLTNKTRSNEADIAAGCHKTACSREDLLLVLS